jgi:hypothetical protein
MEDPKPDMSKLAVQFVGSNVDNIIGTVKKAATVLGSNLNKETQQIIQELPEDSNSSSNTSQSYPQSGQQQPPAGQIIKAGVGILKGLFDSNN